MSPKPSVLLLDCYDSFSYNLKDYLERVGAEVHVLQPDHPPSLVDWSAVDLLVLSPGPGRPREMGHLMDYVAHRLGKTPVLGICLGCQALGEHLGVPLVLGERPMHGKVSVVRQVKAHPVLENLPNSFSVVRYHSLLLAHVPQGAVALLETEKAELMAFAGTAYLGVQFHPEAWETQHGLLLLKNALWTLLAQN